LRLSEPGSHSKSTFYLVAGWLSAAAVAVRNKERHAHLAAPQ
jgi:hypothetical protein